MDTGGCHGSVLYCKQNHVELDRHITKEEEKAEEERLEKEKQEIEARIAESEKKNSEDSKEAV